MPCGTGKTFTAYLIAQEFKNVFITSPLKEFAKQNLDRFVEYGYPRLNTLLVDSDGCRDPEKIKKFMLERVETGFLISATFDSVDVLWKVLDAEYGAVLGSNVLDTEEEYSESGEDEYSESESEPDEVEEESLLSVLLPSEAPQDVLLLLLFIFPYPATRVPRPV